MHLVPSTQPAAARLSVAADRPVVTPREAKIAVLRARLAAAPPAPPVTVARSSEVWVATVTLLRERVVIPVVVLAVVLGVNGYVLARFDGMTAFYVFAGLCVAGLIGATAVVERGLLRRRH